MNIRLRKRIKVIVLQYAQHFSNAHAHHKMVKTSILFCQPWIIFEVNILSSPFNSKKTGIDDLYCVCDPSGSDQYGRYFKLWSTHLCYNPEILFEVARVRSLLHNDKQPLDFKIFIISKFPIFQDFSFSSNWKTTKYVKDLYHICNVQELKSIWE